MPPVQDTFLWITTTWFWQKTMLVYANRDQGVSYRFFVKKGKTTGKSTDDELSNRFFFFVKIPFLERKWISRFVMLDIFLPHAGHFFMMWQWRIWKEQFLLPSLKQVIPQTYRQPPKTCRQRPRTYKQTWFTGHTDRLFTS